MPHGCRDFTAFLDARCLPLIRETNEVRWQRLWKGLAIMSRGTKNIIIENWVDLRFIIIHLNCFFGSVIWMKLNNANIPSATDEESCAMMNNFQNYRFGRPPKAYSHYSGEPHGLHRMVSCLGQDHNLFLKSPRSCPLWKRCKRRRSSPPGTYLFLDAGLFPL